MPKRYAPLLPAIEHHTDAASSSSASASASHLNEDPSKKKRIGTRIACNGCRQRKTRCDGEKPICAACRKRSADCIYADKREREAPDENVDDVLEVLNLCKILPETQALGILRLLRHHHDSTVVLSIINGGMDGKLRPSDHKATRSLAAPTRSPLEFELISRHPFSYRAVEPIAPSSWESSDLLQPVNLRHSVIANSRSAPHTFQTTPQTDLVARSPSTDGDANLSSSVDVSNMQVLPTVPPVYCDHRLHKLRIGFWTDIDVSDAYAARVISLYLETDHPLLAAFDPDLFVSDLVGQQETHCSRFLVCSLMFWGCQMYSAIEQNASELARKFCHEAEKSWLDDHIPDSLTSMAGLQLLSLAFLGSGKNHVVRRYLRDAARMGTRLGLFGVAPTDAAHLDDIAAPDIQTARSYAAWGTFNWIILNSFFYQQPGLEYPSYPPNLPIPGDSVDVEPLENSSKESSPSWRRQSPSYMGDTFPALCRLWYIVHEITLLYHNASESMPIRQHVSLHFVEFKYRELLAWAETLPPSLAQTSDSPHHVVILHMWYHAAILDIFRPFVQRIKPERLRLRTFVSRRSSPAAAYKASVNQLKRLIIIYRSNYDSAAYTMLWHTALIYVANAVLQDTNDPEWRFYFLLCLYGYESLRRSYPIAEVIGRGLLSMALLNGDISSGDARLILRQLGERGLNLLNEEIRGTFMVDLNLAMTDTDAAMVESLAGRFEDIALFRDFTTVEDDVEMDRDTDSEED